MIRFVIVLYCIALYYIVLYFIVLYCIVLYFIVLYCIVLYCIVLYFIVLYCIVLYCISHEKTFRKLWSSSSPERPASHHELVIVVANLCKVSKKVSAVA